MSDSIAAIIVLLLLLVVTIVIVLAVQSPWSRGQGWCRKPARHANTFNVGVTPAGIAITNDGRHVFVANNNNYTIPGSDSVTVLDTRQSQPVTTIQDVSFVQPYTVTMNACSTLAYVTNSASPLTVADAGTVTVINVKTRAVDHVLSGFDGPSSFVLVKNGEAAYVGNYGADGGVGSGNGNTISVVNLSTRTIVATIVVDQAPAAMTASPDGKFVYVVNYVDGNPGTGTFQVIDTALDTVVFTLGGGFSGPFGIAVAPNGKRAYVTNFGSNNFEPYGTTVSVVNLKTVPRVAIEATISVGIQPSGVAVSRDSRTVYVSNYNTLYNSPALTTLVPGQGTVSVIDAKTRKVCNTLIVHQSPANVALCRDRLFVSNYTSNTVVELLV